MHRFLPTTTITIHARPTGSTSANEVVVAPGPGPERFDDFDVVRIRSVALPAYRECRVARPDRRLPEALERFAPDVAHLAAG